MRRAWVTVAVLAGALCVPGTAFAVDHVSLFVSPSAVAGHPGWRLSASVPAREATGGEIVGVSLRRGAESHDLRGVARRTRTVAFDGRRGTWRVRGELGTSLAVNMTIAASGRAQTLGESFGCRGAFVQQPVTLRGRLTVRSGTKLFGTIRRSRLTGTVVFNSGADPDCSRLPTVCSPLTQLRAFHPLYTLTAARDEGGHVNVAVRQEVTRAAWYHRLEFAGFDPLVVAGSSVDVRLPAGLPLSGRGTFTASGPVVTDARCGVSSAAGAFVGSLRARFTGWPSRTLRFGAANAATFASSEARPFG